MTDTTRTDKFLRAAKFLIMDDEFANGMVLERMLEAWGYPNVKGTTDPRETVTLFNEFRPDLILLDLMMPEMDGFQVMQFFHLPKSEKTEKTNCLPGKDAGRQWFDTNIHFGSP